MSGRFENDFPGDAVTEQDGDGFFIGLDSRSEPENLAPGIVSLAENMRFNQRKAVVRAGMEKQTNDISFPNIPLILPFVLTTPPPTLRNSYSNGIFESCVWSDQATNDEYIAVATAESAFLFRPGMSVVQINYPSNELITGTDKVDMFQVAGSLYILRGMEAPALSVTGATLSRVGSTAYLVFAANHNITTGQLGTVAGAYPAWYNVTQAVMTAASANTLTYTTATPTNLGDSLMEVATTTVHNAQQSVALADEWHTASIYVKANGRTVMGLRLASSGASNVTNFFDLTSGTLTTTNTVGSGSFAGTITDAGGGWWRVSTSWQHGSGASSIRVVGVSTGTTTSYLGDITMGLYLFGAQLEVVPSGALSNPTDYQPTTSTAGLKNLLTYSEDLSNAVWTKNDMTATGNVTEEPGTGPFTFNQNKPPLRWDGVTTEDFVLVNQGTISTPFIYMPPSDFGLIMQNRAVLQYTRNQAIISEVLTVEQYNSIYGVFTIRDGEADYLIGFHPYQDNECLVFDRRSIYIIGDLDGDVSVMPKRELTRQIGCVSRRSIATCGQFVMFLSDNGVYVLQPGLELQLRGNTEPLSAAVQNVIDTINTSAIQSAYGIYFNNRYYLAIPTNSSTRNDVMLVYNFLNSQWESVDTFPDGFYCDYMEVINDGARDALYLISLEGGIYEYEVLEVDEFGAADQDPSDYLIAGNLITRRYIFSNTDLKRFTRLACNLKLHANGAMEISVLTANPDSSKIVLTRSTTSEEDVTARGLIGMRAYGAQLQFQNTATRGEIENYQLQAYTQDRKSVSMT